MIIFSNMSPEEFFRLNKDSLPDEIVDKFLALQEELATKETEIKNLERDNELAWEQVGFARDLVETLDNFSERELPKTKQKMYNSIRENAYFEI